MSVDKVKIQHNEDIVLAKSPIPPEQDIKIEKTGHAEFDLNFVSDDIDGFLEDMRKWRGYPPAQYAYHAFGNNKYSWTVGKVNIIRDYACEHGMELRGWENEESGITLLVLKDPDTSEYSGDEIYELMQGNYVSYGLASWYEFEQYGVPIPTGDEEVKEGNGQGVVIVGKGDDWVIIT